MTTRATELTAYSRRYIDLSRTAGDLCQRMPTHYRARLGLTHLNDFQEHR